MLVLFRHQKGMVNYTSTRLPVTIVYYSVFIDNTKALEFEVYLKSGSGRALGLNDFIVFKIKLFVTVRPF